MSFYDERSHPNALQHVPQAFLWCFGTWQSTTTLHQKHLASCKAAAAAASYTSSRACLCRGPYNNRVNTATMHAPTVAGARPSTRQHHPSVLRLLGFKMQQAPQQRVFMQHHTKLVAASCCRNILPCCQSAAWTPTTCHTLSLCDVMG